MNPITSMSQELSRLRGQINSRLAPIDVTVTGLAPLLLETTDGTELEGAIAIGVPLQVGTRAVAFIGDGRVWVQGQVSEGDLSPGELSAEVAGQLEATKLELEMAKEKLLDGEVQANETFAISEQALNDAKVAWDRAEEAADALFKVDGVADQAADAWNASTQAAQDAADALAAAAAAVKNSVVQYATGSSENVAPTTGWSTASPVRSTGTFIWMRSVITYGNDSTATTNPVILTGNAGATGNTGATGSTGSIGATGVGVTKISPYYQTANTGASAPTGNPPGNGWSVSELSYVAGKSLWRMEVVEYSNTSKTYTTPTLVASYEVATLALTTANSKNTIFKVQAPTPPSPPVPPAQAGKAIGDVAWAYLNAALTGTAVAQWTWTGSTWEPTTIGSEIINNLTVDKLAVTGGAQIPLAVIDTLVGQDAFIDRVATTRLAVLNGNLVTMGTVKSTADRDKGMWGPTLSYAAGPGSTGSLTTTSTTNFNAGEVLTLQKNQNYAFSTKLAVGTTTKQIGFALQPATRGASGNWTTSPIGEITLRTRAALNNLKTPAATPVVNTWYTLDTTFTAPESGNYMFQLQFSDSGSAYIQDLNVQSMARGVTIEDGSIVGDKITGGTIIGTEIISPGASAGDSLTIGNQALVIRRADADGDPIITTSLGGSSYDRLVLADSAGRTGVSFDGASGNGALDGTLSVNDLTIGGDTFGSYMEAMPLGVVTFGELTADTPYAGTSALGLAMMWFPMRSNRMYRAKVSGMLAAGTAGDMAQLSWQWFSPSTGIVGIANFPRVTGTADHVDYSVIFKGHGTGPRRIGVLYKNATANRPIFWSGRPNYPVQVSIEDLGLANYNGNDAVAEFTTMGGTPLSGGGTVPPTPATTFVKTYTPSWTRAWRGSGQVTDYLQHGYYGGYQRYSAAGFDVASDMSGATVIKAEVRLTNASWWGSTGTARIGTSTVASAPSSPITSGSTTNVSGWAQGAQKWVTIPWTTSQRAITLGVGAGTGTDGYGKFNNNDVQLRLTYTK